MNIQFIPFSEIFPHCSYFSLQDVTRFFHVDRSMSLLFSNFLKNYYQQNILSESDYHFAALVLEVSITKRCNEVAITFFTLLNGIDSWKKDRLFRIAIGNDNSFIVKEFLQNHLEVVGYSAIKDGLKIAIDSGHTKIALDLLDYLYRSEDVSTLFLDSLRKNQPEVARKILKLFKKIQPDFLGKGFKAAVRGGFTKVVRKILKSETKIDSYFITSSLTIATEKNPKTFEDQKMIQKILDSKFSIDRISLGQMLSSSIELKEESIVRMILSSDRKIDPIFLRSSFGKVIDLSLVSLVKDFLQGNRSKDLGNINYYLSDLISKKEKDLIKELLHYHPVMDAEDFDYFFNSTIDSNDLELISMFLDSKHEISSSALAKALQKVALKEKEAIFDAIVSCTREMEPFDLTRVLNDLVTNQKDEFVQKILGSFRPIDWEICELALL